MSTIESQSLILLDLDGVAFKENPNPNTTFEPVRNLILGENIDLAAKEFNVTGFLEGLRLSEGYQTWQPKEKSWLEGEALLNYLLEERKLDFEELLAVRIDAVRLRDEQIISKIRAEFPYIKIGIATDNFPMTHQVVKHYLPEIEDYLRIVTRDHDINVRKTNPDFFYKAERRLHIPTTNMSLVDDTFANVVAIERAGGVGTLFKPSDQNSPLEGTVLKTIRKSLGGSR